MIELIGGSTIPRKHYFAETLFRGNVG